MCGLPDFGKCHFSVLSGCLKVISLHTEDFRYVIGYLGLFDFSINAFTSDTYNDTADCVSIMPIQVVNRSK